eukprot:gene2905-5702_t
MIALTLIIAISTALSANAYLVSKPFSHRLVRLNRLSMTEEPIVAETDDEEPMPMGMEEPEGFFNSNKRVRLGRSRDQDGKSNIWSIEPRMTVVDEGEEGSGTKTNLLVGGLAIGAAIACLPLFVAFSKLFPDPADF